MKKNYQKVSNKQQYEAFNLEIMTINLSLTFKKKNVTYIISLQVTSHYIRIQKLNNILHQHHILNSFNSF